MQSTMILTQYGDNLNDLLKVRESLNRSVDLNQFNRPEIGLSTWRSFDRQYGSKEISCPIQEYCYRNYNGLGAYIIPDG
jgi:hypothetical protein